MSAKEIRGFGTIEEFFFRQNYLIRTGGAAMVLASNLMWVIVALRQGDPYGRLASASGFFMFTMIGLSALTILAEVNFMKMLKKDKLGNAGAKHKKMNLFTFYVLFYDMMLIASVTSIAIANNDLIARTTQAEPGMTLALSSVLLFVIAFTPAHYVMDSMFIVAGFLASVFIPWMLPSGHYYAFVPELMLRICLVAAYLLLRRRSIDRYEKQVKINEAAEELRTKNHRIIEMSEEVVDLLANAVEMRDPESGAHVKRVKDFSRVLAMSVLRKWPEYGLTPEDVDNIVRASALHDLGKIMIPDGILLKPAKLTAEEFDLMKKHTTFGYDIIMSSPGSWDSDFMKYCVDIVLYHHEKYDGKGYPKGLVGDEIPIAAQIVAVADCYDALISERHYKKAYTTDEAFWMIKDGECGQFSEKILACFDECELDFECIAERVK